jgi:hypothetical protein
MVLGDHQAAGRLARGREPVRGGRPPKALRGARPGYRRPERDGGATLRAVRAAIGAGAPTLGAAGSGRRGVHGPDLRGELAAAAGGVGIGEPDAREAACGASERGAAEAPGELDPGGLDHLLARHRLAARAAGRLPGRVGSRRRLGLRAHERGDPARERPCGGLGRGAHRLLRGRRVLREQADEAAAAALALARRGRLLLGVAVGRLRRDLVDVREDRLAERVQDLGRQAPGRAGLHEPPPRELGAHAVGGQQRVEAAAGMELPAPEVHVRVARPRRVRRRLGDHVHEPVERDLHAHPHELAEGPLHRPRVVRDFRRDRGDHLVGEAGQRGAQHVGGLRRHGGERPASGWRGHLSRGYSR